MPVSSDNLNLNLNLNLGASAGAGGGATGYGRPRFNTEDMCKLAIPLPTTLPLPSLRYSGDWDGEMRAWAFVEEFILECRWGRRLTPITAIRNAINHQNINLPNAFPVPARRVTYRLTPRELANQVNEIGSDIEPIQAGAERLAAEQARYQIQFRQDLAELAERLRRPGS